MACTINLCLTVGFTRREIASDDQSFTLTHSEQTGHLCECTWPWGNVVMESN